MNDYLTTKEIAKNFGVNIITVRRWIDKKMLTAYKFGKDFRIKRSDFELFLKERKVK
jgi:excisionase family DNA binding protein